MQVRLFVRVIAPMTIAAWNRHHFKCLPQLTPPGSRIGSPGSEAGGASVLHVTRTAIGYIQNMSAVFGVAAEPYTSTQDFIIRMSHHHEQRWLWTNVSCADFFE
jgi:hypothetical protein